jgi:hypothetical protein
MSTALEYRLTAALHARAELVQPEDIEHAALRPAVSRPLWRRPAVVGLVAAAAAAVAIAAVVVPLSSRDDQPVDRPLHFDHHWPPSPHHPQPSQKLSNRLSGDVDGDGSPDQVRLTGHALTVTLAADPGHPRTTSVPDAGGLVGLADIGGAGRSVLVSTNDLGTGAEWQAFDLQRGRLGLVLLHDGPAQRSLSVVPGYRTSWLTADGVAMEGRLDPVQEGERHLAVHVSRVEGRSGRPVITPVGNWCWDVVAQQEPAPCAPGTDNAYDPGPHGTLPALLPIYSASEHFIQIDGWHAGDVSLDVAEGPVKEKSVFKQLYVVKGTIEGHHVSASIGPSFPNLVERFMDLGHGVRGLAVANSPETWTLLSFVDGRLVTLAAPTGDNSLHPGVVSVIYRGKGEPAETWIGPDGQVFTTLQTGGPGQDELIQWQVTDSSGTKLEPVDLGRVCVDDFWGTYGTCTTQPGA